MENKILSFAIDYLKITRSDFTNRSLERAAILLKQNWSCRRSGNKRLMHMLSACSLPMGPKTFDNGKSSHSSNNLNRTFRCATSMA